MGLFYDSWKDEKLTDLQRDQFEKNYIGQKVIWVANFASSERRKPRPVSAELEALSTIRA